MNATDQLKSRMLNEQTLRKLQRTHMRQTEALKETEHHIELVKDAIARADQPELPIPPATDPPKPAKK